MSQWVHLMGPALRLVVFLQGCNFRCLYCANPDTIDIKGESTETPIDEIIRMAVSQKAFFGKEGRITLAVANRPYRPKH